MDELRQENKRLKQENQELRERLAATEATIKHLVELLNQNSRNSNWPSSRDKGRRKPKPKSLRQQTDRQAGGQKGHQGHTLTYNPNPEVIKIYRPQTCQHCHSSLPQDTVPHKVNKRQVFDLPPLRFITTEHQAETILCPCCGKTTKTEFPAGVTHPVQYGTQVKRLAVYLRSEQFIPYERSRQMMADLFELPISTGSLQNFMLTGAKQAKSATTAIKRAVTDADVANADETGFYIQGERHWLHTVSTPELTYCVPHRRDLTAIVENEQQQWSAWMIYFLLAAKQLVDEACTTGQTALMDDAIERIHQLYDLIVNFGFAENPLPEANPPPGKRGRRKKTKARNLVERFDKHQEAILHFVHDFKVPFDNNLAERDIRMMKVQQKISGCFRSREGAEQFCHLRSYISTIRKQGLNVWEALGSLFDGDVLMPQLTPV